MYKRFTEQEKEKIKILHENGLTIKQIADHCDGRSCHSVYELVKRIGLINSSRTWTDEQVKILRENYGTGITCEKISSLLKGKSLKAINQKAASLGIKSTFMFRKHEINQDFWTEENPINSYWAGFIAADGCLLARKTTHILAIELSQQDDEHLKLFSKYCGSSHPILYIDAAAKKFSGAKGTVQLQIACPFWSKSLQEKWLITPKKTYSLALPNISEKHMEFWLAGFIDGDGCYCVNGGRLSSSLCCMDERPLVFYRDWIDKNFFSKKRKTKNSSIATNKKNKLLSFCRTGDEAVKSAHYLMSLPCPHLRRKYNKVRQYLIDFPHHGLSLPTYDQHMASLSVTI